MKSHQKEREEQFKCEKGLLKALNIKTDDKRRRSRKEGDFFFFIILEDHFHMDY